ncbi:MAG: mitochondrial fission ELM1 family protein [Alphaproteobacteria bacterium]|nr:mitochondrial fission ELM1 family protein [Alphaproteobacteria bacterium]
MANLPNNIWLLSDGKLGHLNQLRALAGFLGGTSHEITCPLSGWRGSFIKRFGLGAEYLELPALPQTSPDLILSVATAGVLAQAALLHQRPCTARRIHLMSAGAFSSKLDAEILMHHDVDTDFTPNPNQILCTLPPSRMALDDPAYPSVSLPNLPCANIVTLLLGGSNRAFDLTPRVAFALGQKLHTISQDHDFGYYITPSRRTSPQALVALCKGLSNCPHYCWDGSGENPFASMIAHADTVLVSEDSISMQSDVAHAGKPMYIVQFPIKPLGNLLRKHRKFRRYNQNLIEQGYARAFEEDCTAFAVSTCTETQKLAQTIQASL